jgi:hypothetical protein
MSTHTAMLIQSFKHKALKHNALKHKAVALKFTLLLLVSSVISGCLGTSCQLTNSATGEVYLCPTINTGSSVPVVYNSPVSDGVYGLGALTFSVGFPNGIPLKANTEIRLNGVVITSEFNDWGTGIANTARVTGAITAGTKPIIWAALRDGRNSFQVTNPAKSVIFFTVDIPGAEVHFTDINDGWTGETFRIRRAGNVGSGAVSTYEVNGVNVANRDFTAKRGYIDAVGYLDGRDYSNVSQMCVNTYTLSATGVQSSLSALGAGYAMCNTVALGSTSPGSGFYLDFGQADLTAIGDFESPVFVASGAANTAPPTGGWQYSPTGDPAWTHSSTVVTHEVGTPWAPTGGTLTAYGNQYVAIQGTNSMSRSITIPTAGTYSITFHGAQRGSQQQTIAIDINGVQQGTIKPGHQAGQTPATDDDLFLPYTVSIGARTAGTYTLRFRGTNPLGGDNSGLVDNVQLWLYCHPKL